MNISAIGQDSHCFEQDGSTKPLLLGGVVIKGARGLKGNSDADVVLHALVNALSGISGETVLGKITDEMCLKHGITNSRAYVERALATLGGARLMHVSISLECRDPKIEPVCRTIRESVAAMLGLPLLHVCLTATSGEGLTAFGRGEGIAALVIVSAEVKS
ncbi:MAG: 2-C-methyl-D-erythritol 2,4-cyclodiphosphate synthase [Chitinivibrionales bacterium]|nr:2-C-methyl-D-erythritol 2,4-cyclodiphosphate synthase [Chitinivibrionales bacterium]